MKCVLNLFILVMTVTILNNVFAMEGNNAQGITVSDAYERENEYRLAKLRLDSAFGFFFDTDDFMQLRILSLEDRKEIFSNSNCSYLALSSTNPKILNERVEAGANINACNKQGETILDQNDVLPQVLKFRNFCLKCNFSDEDGKVALDSSKIKTYINLFHGLMHREIGGTKKDLMRKAIHNKAICNK